MVYTPPEQLNIAQYFLTDRLEEGRGSREAVRTADGSWTYGEVEGCAARFGHVLKELGVRIEERVIVALPDGVAFVGALFGALKIGAVGVMVNPHQSANDLAWFLQYTRAAVAVVPAEQLAAFDEAARGARHLRALLVVGGDAGPHASWEALNVSAPDALANESTHSDDPAIWLFSGGTTGRPKGVVQPHASFANTTECYAKQVIRYTRDDVTLSVPKLYFGYATGSNLFFPFSVGATTFLFPERSTAAAIFHHVAHQRPTILINVPTLIHRMLDAPEADGTDLSSLRVVTSAGEALPVELHQQWQERFGVELLDGLGTAEMWHIFLSNRSGDVHPGTLGRAVPGFEVVAADERGHPVPDGEVGRMRVRGRSRALRYWQHPARSELAFQGPWYVSGDLVRRTPDGIYSYCGRQDDLLKVSGKWLAPAEVEGTLLQHPQVQECAVVGIEGETGLVKPHAFVVADRPSDGLAEELKAFALERLDPYKHPRQIHFLDALPRTHLEKVDRGRLRRLV